MLILEIFKLPNWTILKKKNNCFNYLMKIHEKAVNVYNFIDEFRNYNLKKRKLLNKNSAFLVFWWKTLWGKGSFCVFQQFLTINILNVIVYPLNKHLNLIARLMRTNIHFFKINNIQKAMPRQQLYKMFSLYSIYVYCAEMKTKNKLPDPSDKYCLESRICVSIQRCQI